jgi:hypothetical protein
MRAEAKGIRSSAAELKAKSDRLLRSLLELEGCKYVPKPPDRPLVQPGQEGSMGPTIVIVEVPRSEGMLLEAAKLERGAERLEAKASGEDVGPPPRGFTGELLVPAEAV